MGGLSGAFVFVKIRPQNIPNTLAFLKQKWKDLIPQEPFQYAFLDEDFNTHYKQDERRGQVFGVSALLTIFVAALGLFGLASFTAEQRTKEVGIRKVLGASISNILLLLTKDFLKLILIANIIAWPLAYTAMNNWLESFAYRANWSINVFLLGGSLALLIALTTVLHQTLRAAQANPVDSLRSE